VRCKGLHADLRPAERTASGPVEPNQKANAWMRFSHGRHGLMFARRNSRADDQHLEIKINR